MSEAEMILRSVSSPGRNGGTAPSTIAVSAGSSPASRAIRAKAASRTRGFHLEPELDHREMPRALHHVVREDVHGFRVAERREPFGVGVHEGLLGRAQRFQRSI